MAHVIRFNRKQGLVDACMARHRRELRASGRDPSAATLTREERDRIFDRETLEAAAATGPTEYPDHWFPEARERVAAAEKAAAAAAELEKRPDGYPAAWMTPIERERAVVAQKEAQAAAELEKEPDGYPASWFPEAAGRWKGGAR